MEEIKFLAEGAKVAGVSVFLFVLFYYYMKKQYESFQRILEDQRARDREVLEATVSTFRHITEKSDAREDRHFRMMNDQMEIQQHFAGSLARMEHKLDTWINRERR